MNATAGRLAGPGPWRTTCPYCGVGCGLEVLRDSDGNVDIRGDATHPANLGRVCSKGAALGDTLDLEGRLLHPIVDGVRVDWSCALDAVASRLSATIAEHGPDSVAFYVSGQLLTEDYYVANKLMKGFIGSANIDTNSRLCMASAVAGYKRAFGSDTVPCEYADVERADLLVIVGSNVAWCHPVLYQRIVRAKQQNPKLFVVVIDPRRTATCDVADLVLAIKPATDIVLFNGLLNYLRREDALDWEFLDAHTEGIGAAMQTAKASAPSIPVVASTCGLREQDVAELYRIFARTERVVTLFSQGVNQSSCGTDKVNSIVNVHLATGRLGKAGAGPFSLTGQPNAMGGREVGGLANQLAAHMDFAPEEIDRVARFWRAPRIASRPGLKAVELFRAIDAGAIKAVWIMATNPVVSMPDADAVRRALDSCKLVIVSDCMARTDTTACADILLPAATWGEKSGTVTNSERRISRQRAFLAVPGESRPDWWIVSEVAKRMGFEAAFSYTSPADIFREHAQLSAFENGGARDFDIGGLARLDDAEYEALAPTLWPAPAAPAASSGRMFADRAFFTPTGKAHFIATGAGGPARASTDEYPLVLNTGRVRDQWHTMTRTGYSARLSGRHVEPFVQVHPGDARHAGVTHGDLAAIVSPVGRFVGRVDVTSDVQPGHLFAPMHWNAQFATAARVGTLLEALVDPVSGQPELKHAPVRLERYSPLWYGFALTHEPFEFCDCAYVAASKGAGYWRYELAGDVSPAAWSAWVTPLLGARDDRIELVDGARGHYRGAAVRANRLRACIFISSHKTLPPRGWLGSLFGEEMLGDVARLGLLSGRALDGAPDHGPIVCSCFTVGRSTLLRAIRTQALVSTDEIGRTLKAGTNCGSCVPELEALLVEAAPAV